MNISKIELFDQILYQENSLDELLRLVEMNEFLACDVEMGGCGQQNYIHYLLRAAPHVFITGLCPCAILLKFDNLALTSLFLLQFWGGRIAGRVLKIFLRRWMLLQLIWMLVLFIVALTVGLDID